MIGIIDYKAGNLLNVSHAVNRLGYEAVITDDTDLLSKAEALILPGVGAFGSCVENFRNSGLQPFVDKWINDGKYILGICVGMQMLFERSFEMGEYKGLGYFKGDVVRFEEPLKVPHMGWNTLNINRPDPLLDGVENGNYVYFVHSYHALADKNDVIAYTDYGTDVTAIIGRENIYATQFHPEKSSKTGELILKNYLTIATGGEK
ncbi:MAG: imidazole glycerol phosphate synthase subunit HisH [Eubacteriaceae bacterium]|nr:imidazole glycerol phosphate synthase subunit HisH [Eubacteriaceae bacterium]